jgi:hypothetical protein
MDSYVFPALTPTHLRSRTLKKLYDDWKDGDKVHISESGLTANYIMYCAKQEGIDFLLTYNSTFNCFRISRN